jgi:2-oxoisovalerate dehydrogenase E1 component
MTARRRSPSASSRFSADNDRIVATYREHGHALARGVPMPVMAEMYGKAEGCSGGRGGSMHLFDAAIQFLWRQRHCRRRPAAGRSAWRWPTRCGADDRVTACFFGEGAVAEGEFHETMNLAELWDLPALFVCENNGYAMGSALGRTESETDIHAKAAAYGIARRSRRRHGRGRRRGRRAPRHRRIRETGGPIFLECRTYRFRAHSMFDAQLYRDKDGDREVARQGADRPLPGLAAGNHLIHDSDIARDRGRSRCRD